MELQEKSGTTCPPFVLEAKSRLENVELKSSLQFLAAISKAFNEKTEIIEQNVEETRNALLLKLNSLKELELESRGRELLTLLANSVRSRNLDEIKFNLEETGNHEKTCKEVDFEFKLYSTALLESYAESLPDIRSQLYSFLEKKLKFPFEEGNATVVAHEDATVLHKYVDIITYLMKRTHPDDWPTEIAAIFFKPISDRFLYHFYGDRKTNDKYNPRWFLTQLLSWIRVNLLFFEQTMGVAKGITSFNPAAFFHYRISALANDKIASILSMDEAMTDPLLFSKLVDEVVQFEEDRQQLDCFRYGVNSLTMFCSEKIVKHWIQMEHEVSIAYLDDILSDGKRWTGRLGEIDDVDEYNVCQCVDSFVTHVQCVHNRSRLLPDPYVKRLFIDLQLFLFDEFRERLSQIANTADSPWSEPFPQIMNATWFLCDTLKEWSETDILNTRLGEGSTLDSTSRMYKHLWTQMADNAANSVRIQTTEMAQQYQQYKWASVDLIMSPSKEISPPFCPLLLKIRSIFATAGNVLSRVSLNTIFKRFITVVADVLYKEVIRCTAFVEFGASQMLFDIEEGLVPVLNNIFDRNRLSSVQSTNNLQMLKLISALRILSLPWPVATLLREEISTPEQVNEKLLEMKIVGLTGDEAEKLFGQRSDMKSTNIKERDDMPECNMGTESSTGSTKLISGDHREEEEVLQDPVYQGSDFQAFQLKLCNHATFSGVPADRGGCSIEDLVRPKKVSPSRFSAAGGEEFVKALSPQIALILEEFARRPVIRELAAENGLNNKLFMASYKNFKEYCLSAVGGVEPALLVALHDIVNDGHNVDTIFPFFIAHARKVFPHLEAIDDLRMISDLTEPHNWYPEARTVQRKIVFHAGPTNSGKTYHALQRFHEAKSGVYCGPLKLLAAEIFRRSNESGVKCDMVTGEERRFAIDNTHPSAHLSSTVEMLSTHMRVELAVIDEIQMLRDDQRGWAWTRALLGVAADEVHLCGEASAIDIVKKLLKPIGEEVEVRHYERMTPLTIATEGIGSLDNIQPGDCIVCFGKKAIFNVSSSLERLGIKPAVIYGDLPPGTKVAMAAKFNDPNDPCKVLVATDAVGMGLNLNIKRVIFHSLLRKGELLPVHAALQIAGRAGRFGTSYADGVATTLKNSDIGLLRDILAQPIVPIQSVGISPTFEQIETFSFHLPQASFVHLLDLFISVCSISDHFFICAVEQMKELAELIDYISLPLKVRYTFCCCPISTDNKFAATIFVKMARRFSSGQGLTFDWLMDLLNWPPAMPTSIAELVTLERIYEVLEVYLWLSLRFPDMLPDELEIRNATKELDVLIQEGMENILELLENQMPIGKEGSMANKLRQKAQTAREKEELEEIQSKNEEKLPSKRKGKRRSVLDTLVARAGLTNEELEELKNEIRDEEK